MQLIRVLLHIAAAVSFSLVLMVRSLMAADITINVPKDFKSIQDAINNAEQRGISNPENTYNVLVEPGVYSGGIQLKSKISIRGRETARTIITGGGTLPLMIAAGVTNVSISNFTFGNAGVQAGIAVGSNSASIRIRNNVFAVGLDGVGVFVQSAPTTEIINNTFFQNKFAVSRDADGVLITNNIFSTNTENIHLTAGTEGNISYNAFHPKPFDTEPRGTSFIPNDFEPDSEPLFVNISDIVNSIPDFHLQTGSPCIDRGDTSLSDPYTAPTQTSNRSDIGAYGGPNADTIPFPVLGLKDDSPSTTSAALAWSANKAYNIKGYKVYYGRSSGSYDGVDAIYSGVTRTSPIDVGNVLNATIENLSTTVVATPAAPVQNGLVPSSGSLVASWSAVPGATSYKVHYGISSVAENTTDVGNVTSYSLSGLVNGEIYQVAVSAVAQSAYYIAVTAYDDSGQTSTAGQPHESAFSTEFLKLTGAPVESGLSNIVSDFPEELVAVPPLTNSSLGCFIATAAYGNYSAPEVRILRRFRDRFLITNRIGSAFVGWYYEQSPAAAAYLNAHPGLKPAVRAALMPMVGAALFMTQTTPLFKTVLLFIIGLFIAAAFSRKKASGAGGIH